jgi:hypothetical protein
MGEFKKNKLLSKKTKPKIKKKIKEKDIRPGPNMVCLTNLHGPGN